MKFIEVIEGEVSYFEFLSGTESSEPGSYSSASLGLDPAYLEGEKGSGAEVIEGETLTLNSCRGQNQVNLAQESCSS